MSKAEAYRKVFKVIHSCKTLLQLDAARKMSENFTKVYGKCFFNGNIETLLGLMKIKINGYRDY